MPAFRLCGFADEADSMLDGQISALRGNGMDLVELRGIDGKNVAALTPKEAKETAQRLRDAGIGVWSVGSPIGKVDISSPADDETDRFMRILDTAVICGAENIRLFSFYGTGGDSRYLDEVVRRLRTMLERSAGSGVALCHENEKGIYGDTADRCAAIHEALPGLRGVFDPANYVQCGEDILTAWEKLSGYIKYAHIKDALPDGRVVPPGDGVGHLPELLPLFSGAGVGVLTLEPHLRVFKGLSSLEGGKRPPVGSDAVPQFASGREAFDFAASKLRGLISAL